MTGKLNPPKPLAAGLLPWIKRPAPLVGIVILAIAAAATGAWLTEPPASAPPRVAKAGKAKRAVVEVPPAAATPVMPDAAAEPATPPEPAATTGKAGPPAASPSEPPRSSEPPKSSEPAKPADWATMPIDELRARANANEIPAMEDLARRLIQGAGVTKDQQAGAGWLLRAAQRGSAQSAFNVAVMYERGFVVERDSTRAVEWYRKAVDANLPVAKHNLALLLRDGRGAARDGKEAVELLRSAARQGMAASMFTLGDIHERGDAAPKDPATALAWFAVAAEFERQTNRGAETALAKTAAQRVETLQRILTPSELERAQQIGQSEFKYIVEALSPPKPPPEGPATAGTATTPPLAASDPPGWPKAVSDQIRAIQKALVDLKYLNDKPDGVIGPVTRAAVRSFQRSIGARETGEPTKDVYAALKEALATRDVVANSPPPPVKTGPPKVDPPKPAPTAAVPETTSVQAKSEPPTAIVDLGQPEPAPAPPTSADFLRAAPRIEPAKPAPEAWPTLAADQVRAIQRLLLELKYSRDVPDGLIGPNTRAAIRDYERAAGLNVTGEPSKALFEALAETRLTAAPKSD
jgi:peptidoglycan hydrolase-like protein with peptidoglycan-binding domain